MVKLFSLYFPKSTLLLFVTECTLLWAAFIGAVFLHFGASARSMLTIDGCLKVGAIAVICLFCLYYSDLYAPLVVGSARAVHSRLIQGLGVACLVMSAIFYILPSIQFFRGFAVTGIVIATIFLVFYRRVFFTLNKSVQIVESTLIMGEGRFAASLAKVIQDRPDLGLGLIGYLGKEWGPNSGATCPRHLGGTEDLTRIVSEMKVRRVIVAMGDQRSKLPINELLALKTSGVTIQEGADFYELTTGKLPIEALRLSWLVFSPGFRVSKIILIYKRAVSLLLAGLGLLFLSPLIALIALAIRLDSSGPVIFKQLRIGKGGQPFTLFKFRTMFVDADLGGYPRPAEHNDQRVTRVGRWLRRFRLDEIPQLYNILRGQMYFVGPRPFVPEQEMELAQQIPLYTQRWTVKPGATGWAQVQRGYCASLRDNTDKLAYDLFYIKNTSISLDVLILIKTIKIVFAGQGGR